MEGWPTGAVAASTRPELTDAVTRMYSNEYMRVYQTDDVIGVEVGGKLSVDNANCM